MFGYRIFAYIILLDRNWRRRTVNYVHFKVNIISKDKETK